MPSGGVSERSRGRSATRRLPRLACLAPLSLLRAVLLDPHDRLHAALVTVEGRVHSTGEVVRLGGGDGGGVGDGVADCGVGDGVVDCGVLVGVGVVLGHPSPGPGAA